MELYPVTLLVSVPFQVLLGWTPAPDPVLRHSDGHAATVSKGELHSCEPIRCRVMRVREDTRGQNIVSCAGARRRGRLQLRFSALDK